MGSKPGRKLITWEDRRCGPLFKAMAVALKNEKNLGRRESWKFFAALVPWAVRYFWETQRLELTEHKFLERQHKGTYFKNKFEWPHVVHPGFYEWAVHFIERGQPLVRPEVEQLCAQLAEDERTGAQPMLPDKIRLTLYVASFKGKDWSKIGICSIRDRRLDGLHRQYIGMELDYYDCKLLLERHARDVERVIKSRFANKRVWEADTEVFSVSPEELKAAVEEVMTELKIKTLPDAPDAAPPVRSRK